MGKVGRFVTDPKAGAYCQITLDSGDKIVVNHDKGGFKGGRLVIEKAKWWGGGECLFECDLDSPAGKAALSRLLRGVPGGGSDATPLGAFVNHVKDAKSAQDVRALCGRLVAESEG